MLRAPEQLSLSLSVRGALLLRLSQRLEFLRSNVVLLAAASLLGQLTVAYMALSPSVTAEPDGGSPLRLLLPYSAMMLGFLSSYWGLWRPDEKDDDDAPYSARGAALKERRRLIVSLAPTIIGGASMLLPLALPATAGLMLLIGGFLLLLGMEYWGRRTDMPIAGYHTIRWTVSGAALAILLNVASARLWDYSLLF